MIWISYQKNFSGRRWWAAHMRQEGRFGPRDFGYGTTTSRTTSTTGRDAPSTVRSTVNLA